MFKQFTDYVLVRLGGLRCSGDGVYPSGLKCPGCFDCDVKDPEALAFKKLRAAGLNHGRDAFDAYCVIAAVFGSSILEIVDATIDASHFNFEKLKEFAVRAKVDGELISFTFRGETETIRKEPREVEGFIINRLWIKITRSCD